MPQTLDITILGCGGSAGVPGAGNYWGRCNPDQPRNVRSRCSLVVQSDETSIIIDTGADFRAQTIREDIRRVDAVLYTHYHGDHVDGIGDLRGFRFRQDKLLPIYANRETLDVFDRSVPHLTRGGSLEIYPPVLDVHEITPEMFGKVMRVGDIDVIPFEQDHKSCMSLGYRFGDFAYSVDVLKIDQAGLDILKGVKTWIVDGAGYVDQNPVHACLDDIYAMNEYVGAEQVYITSLTLAMDYDDVRAALRSGYAPAYDGMKLIAEQL